MSMRAATCSGLRRDVRRLLGGLGGLDGLDGLVAGSLTCPLGTC